MEFVVMVAVESLPARRRPPAAAIAYLSRPISDFQRENARAFDFQLRAAKGERMKPTRQEIEALRGLVRWARSHEGDAELRVRTLADALERAIAATENDHDSVTEMLLVAMHQALERMYGNKWRIVDQDLIDFVGQELNKRYGPNPGPPRPEPKPPLFG
jgi:hypothetical protein